MSLGNTPTSPQAPPSDNAVEMASKQSSDGPDQSQPAFDPPKQVTEVLASEVRRIANPSVVFCCEC